MQIRTTLPFSCVHVTALDASGTECAYAEYVNRHVLTPEMIGQAVINAVARLVSLDCDPGVIVVRFSDDT
jgi:hypothetical protein